MLGEIPHMRYIDSFDVLEEPKACLLYTSVRGVIQEFEENNSGVDLFHFDSDGDVFCVYSQYIDDLMLLSNCLLYTSRETFDPQIS